MYYRPALLIHGRVVRFHAEVETQQEVCEIESYAEAVGRRNLLIEGIEAEQTAGLVLIVADSPHITGIDKYSTLDNPEKLCAEFEREVKPYVAALVYKVGHGVLGIV